MPDNSPQLSTNLTGGEQRIEVQPRYVQFQGFIDDDGNIIGGLVYGSGNPLVGEPGPELMLLPDGREIYRYDISEIETAHARGVPYMIDNITGIPAERIREHIAELREEAENDRVRCEFWTIDDAGTY